MLDVARAKPALNPNGPEHSCPGAVQASAGDDCKDGTLAACIHFARKRTNAFAPTWIASSDIPTRHHINGANNPTGMPISEVQKKKAKPICAIAKPENPARMLPGKWRLPCPRASFFPLLRPA